MTWTRSLAWLRSEPWPGHADVGPVVLVLRPGTSTPLPVPGGTSMLVTQLTGTSTLAVASVGTSTLRQE